MPRSFSLANLAREYVWLYDYRHGISPEKIAARDGVSPRSVRAGIERAEAVEARLSRPLVIDDDTID